MVINATDETILGNSTRSAVPYAFQYAYLALGIIITLLSLATIRKLWICKKLTNQIRLMSMHMTISNLLYGITMICNFIYGKTTSRYRCPAVLKVIPIAFVIYNVFLTVSGFDRLLSLKFSLKYRLWQNTRNTRIFIASLYIFGMCVNIPNLQMNCPTDNIAMFTYSGLVCFVCTGLLLIFCDVIIYSYIGIIALKTKVADRDRAIATRRANDYNRFWLATMKSFILSVLTLLLLGPFVISKLQSMCSITGS